MSKTRHAGFTLIELMTTVAVIGILMAIAVPQYNEYTIKGKLSEAFSQLTTLQVRMEQYYQDNRSYASSGTTCGIAAPTTGIQYFAYSCVANNSGQGYTYTADSTGTNGAGLGFSYTVTETGAKSTTAVVNSAWGSAPLSCWVRNKGGC